jgi:DNA-binding MurR/RpiR family transcriptional regulator
MGASPLEAATNLKETGRSELVIGFSLMGMDLDTANVIRFARERGAATFVFSASPAAAAALEAETAIICPGPTQTNIPSFTGLAAMIVVISAAFAARHAEEAAEMTSDLRQSYREFLEMQVKSASELDIEALWRQF